MSKAIVIHTQVTFELFNYTFMCIVYYLLLHFDAGDPFDVRSSNHATILHTCGPKCTALCFPIKISNEHSQIIGAAFNSLSHFQFHSISFSLFYLFIMLIGKFIFGF